MKKIYILFLSLIFALPQLCLAASNFYLSPETDSAIIGNIFSVSVLVDSGPSFINAVKAHLTFDKSKFIIQSLDTSKSIFSAWPELSFSNEDGIIKFAAGLPNPGFKGKDGKVLTINFKGIALGKGNASFVGGVSSILLNDGLGTENFGAATGGSYTILPKPLSVSCSASPSSANVGGKVTFSASASGESGTYTYSWTGACAGTLASCAKTFDTTGTKSVTVTASSNGKTKTASCSASIGYPDLQVSCTAPENVDMNQPITFKSVASGGDGEYSYEWTDCLSTASECTNTYDTTGMRKVSVKVVSGGKNASASCNFSVNKICPPSSIDECPKCGECNCGVSGAVASDNKDKDVPTQVLGTLISRVDKIAEIPQVAATTKAIATTGVAISILPLLEMLLAPLRFIAFFMGIFSPRKKKNPWGIIYDSVTKQPIDPALVTLKYADNGQGVASSITDLEGRYGFFVEPDSYQIAVGKSNYSFPSKILAGKKKDELYENLYFGENINVKELGEVITKNIPLDPVNFDWNEFAKKNQKIAKARSVWEPILRKIFDFIFYLGFSVSIVMFVFVPNFYNLIVFGLYLIMLFLRGAGLRERPQGTILDKATEVPLAYAIVRVFGYGTDVEIAKKSADRFGRYYSLVPPGKYYVKIEKKNRDGSYSLAYTSSAIDVSREGIIKEKFEI